MLDRFPAELIHTLLKYFTFHEVHHTFAGINDHFNRIVYSYHGYRVNLKSIQRYDFEFVCHRIRPDQVLSLTLSDDCDTPGQSELFLSHFHIGQFVNLRRLRLIAIDPHSLQSISADLPKLTKLQCFSLRQFNLCEDDSSLGVDDLQNTCVRLSPYSETDRIVELSLQNCYARTLQLASSAHLLHLEIDYHSSPYPISPAFRRAPHLKSLVLIFPKARDLTDISSCQTLEKLHLSLDGVIGNLPERSAESETSADPMERRAFFSFRC